MAASATGRGLLARGALGVQGWDARQGLEHPMPGLRGHHGSTCPLLPPAPSLQLMARDTSRLHISPDMKAPRFGGEAAVTGAKLCVSGFGDMIYYRSLGTGLRPSTHFSWATLAPPSMSAGGPSAGRPPPPLLTQQFGSLDIYFFFNEKFSCKRAGPGL